MASIQPAKQALQQFPLLGKQGSLLLDQLRLLVNQLLQHGGKLPVALQPFTFLQRSPLLLVEVLDVQPVAGAGLCSHGARSRSPQQGTESSARS